MTEEQLLFLLLMLFNLCIIALYICYYLLKRRGELKKCFLGAVTMFLCPIIGPLFLALATLFRRMFWMWTVDISDVVFGKEKDRDYFLPEEDTEKNMVSLQEALEITDKQNLRKLMINVIKGDYKGTLASISKALNSEDSETAHYAASVLQDVLNEFRMTVQKTYVACQEESEHQAEQCVELIDYMSTILEQKVFTEIEQKSMVDLLEHVADICYQKQAERLTIVEYEIVILRLLDERAYERCELWCERARAQYPYTKETYACLLKLYFATGDQEKFRNTMDLLRQSEIVIDNQMLEMIRAFSEN